MTESQTNLGGQRHRFPATGMVFIAAISTQTGAALAKHLFATLGATGTVSLRVGIAALCVWLIWRPRWRGWPARAYLHAGAFGLFLALMNLSFYSALWHIPLGVAVSLEFVGPLGVAVAHSRKGTDYIWVLFAAVGIALLAPWTGSQLSWQGVLLALVAGCCWAGYILLGASVGRQLPGVTGLSIALAIGSILLIPFGIHTAGRKLISISALLQGLGVSLLSSVIPYSLELEALRRIPPRIFGLLMSLEPLIATLAGWLFLREALSLRAFIAILLITVAMMGVTLQGARQTRQTAEIRRD